MPSDDPQTVLFTSDLGLVGNHDPTVLARLTAKGSLHAGRLFLRATLDEMVKIRSMSKSTGEDHHDLLRETRAQYDDLRVRGRELESLDKRKWIFKLFNRGAANAVKRAKRAFVADTAELWDSTMTKSDTLKRTILSTSTADLAPVESESVPNELLSGVAMDLNGPVTQEAIAIAREVMSILATRNPLAVPTPDDDRDEQASTPSAIPEDEPLSSARSSISPSPSSPSSASSFSYLSFGSFNTVNVNLVNSTDSDTPGITFNNSGSGNTGSECSVVPVPPSSVNSPPS